MASKDLFNNVKVVPAFDVRTISSNATTSGDIIDTAGFESVTFVFQTGTVSDGDYTVVIRDGDDSGLSDGAAVADAFLLGTEAGASFSADTDDNDIGKVGYIGGKRYVQMQIVSTNVSSGAVVGGTCILGHPTDAPQSTQITRD